MIIVHSHNRTHCSRQTRGWRSRNTVCFFFVDRVVCCILPLNSNRVHYSRNLLLTFQAEQWSERFSMNHQRIWPPSKWLAIFRSHAKSTTAKSSPIKNNEKNINNRRFLQGALNCTVIIDWECRVPMFMFTSCNY